MERKDNGENQLIDVSVGRWNDTEYAFHISILRDQEGDNHYFIVDKNLNIYNMPHSTSEYIDRLETDLDEHREEVQKLIDDATAAWPFID